VESLELAKSEGVTIYDVDTSLFAAKVAPMLEEVENPDVRELLKQIAEVK
jgi:TRAP-type C4-dicarboxylate transport system substrate-binding protein